MSQPSTWLHCTPALQADLHACTQGGQPGVLDETLLRVLTILDEQLFGLAAEDREAAPATGREAKRNRGPETYALLAQGTTLADKLADVLSLVCLLADAAQDASLADSWLQLKWCLAEV